MESPGFFSSLSLFLIVFTLALSAPLENKGLITHLVTFGDSYTDQSRLAYWAQNKTYPPPHYQEVYPPYFRSANGGASWARYAEIYGKLEGYNYAVAGAVCDNDQTGNRSNIPGYPGGYVPDVTGYQIPALLTDWAENNQNLSLNPDTTVYSIWIGTNDAHSIAAEKQAKGVTIEDVVKCTLKWATTLHGHGARNFIFQNMVPLQLAPMFANSNLTAKIEAIVDQGNQAWAEQIPQLIQQLGDGVQATLFDSHALFGEMYRNPSSYLNGSLPLNVTGDVQESNRKNSPDSFLWADNLHPSEQSSRIVAREIFNTLERKKTKWASYYGW